MYIVLFLLSIYLRIKIFTLMNYSVMLLGYLISGPVAEFIGMVNVFKISSICGICFTILLYYSSRVNRINQFMKERLNVSVIYEDQNNSQAEVVQI